MTTIAWDTCVLAADTLCVTEDNAVIYGAKIWETPLGLFGGAGDDPLIESVLRWLLCGGAAKHQPKMADNANFVGLLIKPNGSVVLLDKFMFPVTYFSQSFAIGTGGNAALALMSTGMTAPDAVQHIIDKNLDKDTGGGVTTLRLGRLPEVRRAMRLFD